MKRVADHKAGVGSALTKRYKVPALVWFEEFSDGEDAIRLEAKLKSHYRAWKINRIEQMNPRWADLHQTLPGVRANSID